MTAWLAVVVLICILAKCFVDFITLEYGNKFQFVTGEQLLVGFVALCGYALFVDFINFVRSRR